MKKSLLIAALSLNISVTGCSYVMENLPGIYRIDIKQGNIIDQDMIDQLRPNMSKRQVLYIMGSPMLADFFHKDRWDYIYSIRERGTPTTQKRIALYFKDDSLMKIEGDFKPVNAAGIKPSKDVTVDVPPRKLDKTLWEMITGLFDFSDRGKAVNTATMKGAGSDKPLDVKDIPD